MPQRSYSDPVHFLPSEGNFEKAAQIFKKKKEQLAKMFPDADIQHVGSSSVPGAWGKFDIDIQIRIEHGLFRDASEALQKVFEEKHPHLWTDQFVTFCDNRECMVDIILTEKDSKYDDFYRVRDALIADPKLLEEYNSIKKRFDAKPYREYKEAKSAFFGEFGKVRFLKYVL